MQKKKNSYKEIFTAFSNYSPKNIAEIFINRLYRDSLNVEGIIKKIDEWNDELAAFDSFILVTKYTTMTFMYASESCKQVTGYSPEEWTKGGIPFYLENYCPAERLEGQKYINIILQHLAQCPINEKSAYNYTSTFRFYHKSGYYFWLYNHLIFYLHDETGKTLLSISILTDIDKFKCNDDISLKIIKHIPKTREYNIEQSYDMPPEGLNLLNNCELKILKMLSEGLDNEKISKKLNLSSYTIRDYRKNMLKKTWCSNTVELVYYALRNNLIQ